MFFGRRRNPPTVLKERESTWLVQELPDSPHPRRVQIFEHVRLTDSPSEFGPFYPDGMTPGVTLEKYENSDNVLIPASPDMRCVPLRELRAALAKLEGKAT